MTSPAKIRVDEQLACDDPEVPDAERIRDWVASAIAGADVPATGKSEVTVRVVGVKEMRTLNREYRDKDKPTNVLSFPADEVAGLPGDEARALGDLVVCAPVVRDESAQQDKAPADHWAHMLVHGTLHLLGYDHMSASQAAEMENLEVRILTSQGVADPYRA